MPKSSAFPLDPDAEYVAFRASGRQGVLIRVDRWIAIVERIFENFIIPESKEGSGLGYPSRSIPIILKLDDGEEGLSCGDLSLYRSIDAIGPNFLNHQPCPLRIDKGFRVKQSGFGGFLCGLSLSRKFAEGKNGYHYAANAYKKQRYVWGVFGSKETAEIAFRYTLGPLALYGGAILLYFACGYQRRWRRWAFSIIGICLITAGLSALTLPRYWQDDCYEYRECQSFPQ